MAEMENNQTQDLPPSDDGLDEQTPAALEAVSDESAELDREEEEEVEVLAMEEKDVADAEMEESTTPDQEETEALLEGEEPGNGGEADDASDLEGSSPDLEVESEAEAPVEDEEHVSLDEPEDDTVLGDLEEDRVNESMTADAVEEHMSEPVAEIETTAESGEMESSIVEVEPELASEIETEVVETKEESVATVENEIDMAVESDLSAVDEDFEPEPEVEVEQPAEPEAVEPEGEPDDGRHWYVVHCYSGYENKVRHNLEQRIETMGMKAKIFDVVVPTEEEIEVKDGKRRTVERRVFPGYILVQMILSEESWYVVRNTPGVTGFVGMGNEPTPLRPEEVASIVKRMEAEAPRIKVSYTVGQKVRIIDGPFNDFIGTVDNIDMERAKVRVMVSFFGRDTPVELDFLQVDKG
jgi:transcriptional antiterminator NusG